jgi:outer membrane protein OmpA-like peptidoglycan-associated protein
MYIVLIISVQSNAQEDKKGCIDHPLLSRMQDYYASDCSELEYESYNFYDSKRNKYEIEGKLWKIVYKIKKGIEPPGEINVRKNYINAIKKIGGTVLQEDQHTYMKVVKEGKETWIELNLASTSNGNRFTLVIVERTAHEQEVVADPKAMGDDIERTGRVAIYGIYFDTDSYKIKPESEPTLKAIAELLKAKSNLNVYVIGHTDMTGDLDHNMKLSENRAKAVVDALVADYGISAKRLSAKGDGPLAPVSTNKTDEGRQLNRRVELVER